MTTAEAIRAFYLQPATMTALPDDLPSLPPDVPGLFRLVQGLMLHRYWGGAYGETISEARQAQAQLRSSCAVLELTSSIDAAPITEARPPSRRVVGVCRHFSVLGVALLRRQGIPARARCGFGLYFDGTPVDHWVIEYWDGAAWRLGDAQMDAVQRAALKLPFDPLDVPRDQFIVGGEAWRRCRAGEADPQSFGIMDLRGLWFVAGNVVRDIAALNNMEMLPWDVWGTMMFEPGKTPDPAQFARLDAAVPLSVAPDDHFSELRALYDGDADWRVPERVLNVQTQQLEAA